MSDSEIARAMTYNLVTDDDAKVEGCDYVQFNAFFTRDLDNDGYAEKYDGTCNQIGNKVLLYFDINVLTDGKLLDGKVTINGKNFSLSTNLVKDEVLKNNYISSNTKTIEFNNLNAGSQKLFSGNISASIGNNINNYSVDNNTVTLTGTWQSTDGTRTVGIKKVVTLKTDWYGYTSTSASGTSMSHAISDAIGTDGIILKFNVGYNETRNQLLIQKQRTEVTIPNYNGYEPTEVMVNSQNCNVEYNEGTRLLTIEREASVLANGTITNSVARTNSYEIQVKYPLEAYNELSGDTISVTFPSRGYYWGFNNKSDEFRKDNPHMSQTSASFANTWRKPEGKVARFDVYVGKNGIISKDLPLQIYNNVELDNGKSDEYIVQWRGFTGNTYENQNGIWMEEYQTDSFQNSAGQYISMRNYMYTKGLYFSNLDGILEDDGWIKVYDGETNELLETFTKDTWKGISSTNPYYFDKEIHSIKIETSKAEDSSYIYVYQIKEINDEKLTTDYTYEKFSELNRIWSYLRGGLFKNTEKSEINTDMEQALYEEPFTDAKFSTTPSSMANNETKKMTFTIDTTNIQFNQKKWKNGQFLIELPGEILNVELIRVISNNSNVEVISYETYEQNNKQYIKIYTENEEDTTFRLTIEANIMGDPRRASSNKSINLYAVNEMCQNYKSKISDTLDINGNGNTTENVLYKTSSINIIAPSSLFTLQTLSDYDDTGMEIVSPRVAEFDKSDNSRDAKINVTVTNNYSGTVSEPIIIGKIPFAGNTYQINGGSLGSTFSVTMKDTGISVPDSVKGVAKVYYSTNEIVTEDMKDPNNNWKTANEVTDWSKVKTYAVDLSDYVLKRADSLTFSYNIVIPNNMNYNDITYSTHGIYYCLDTQDGKLRTRTEVNRLGIKIVKKYNIEITKYQKDTDKVVKSATYKLIEDGQTTGRTGITNENGKFTINNMYAEKTYVLKEIRTPNQYELNEEEIKFTTIVNEEGNLEGRLISGTLREGSSLVARNTGNGFVLEIQVEDEVRPNLKITKVEEGTENKIQNVRYKLTGKGFESGRILKTDWTGEASFVGLYVNEEYMLEEIKAEGYYLASPIKFKIINNNGKYEVQKIDGVIADISTETVDYIPTIDLKLEDEKIPTYDLEISKIKKIVELSEDENAEEVTYLSGAQFKLYKDGKEIGTYTSGEDGKFTIEGLYQYEADRGLDQTYKLKEIFAPDGYSKVKDITFRVEKVDGTLQFIEEVADGQTEKKYKVDGTTIKLIVEDAPSFKLIKKDAETKQALSGIKFALYNTEDGDTPAVNSKGEILGTKEIINGKEYYTITTDKNGEFTADLTEGLYKAIEVEAPDKYDISKSTYYFGIGMSKKTRKEPIAEWAKGVSQNDGSININSGIATVDGGYIVVGKYTGDVVLDNGVSLEADKGQGDGIIIKYDTNGTVQFTKSIGGSASDGINSIVEVPNDGYVVGGYFGSNLDLGNGVTLKNNGDADGMIIKYDNEWNAQWAQIVGGTGSDEIKEIKIIPNEGYIVGGYFDGDIDLENGITLNGKGTMIIKYDVLGNVVWANSTKVNSTDKNPSATINSLDVIPNEGYIIGGHFDSSSLDLGDGTTLENKDSSWKAGSSDAMLIMYDIDGNIKWAKHIGGNREDQINDGTVTSDGNYIMVLESESEIIELGDGTPLENKYSEIRGITIKYDIDGKICWKDVMNIDSWYNIELMKMSVVSTADGGCVVGRSYDNHDGTAGCCLAYFTSGELVIKYDKDGNINWIKELDSFQWDDNSYDYSKYLHAGTKVLTSSSNDEYIVLGKFLTETLDFGNGVVLENNNGESILKLKEEYTPDLEKKQGISFGGEYNEEITVVEKTRDGGYIAGGYFESEKVDLGNGNILNKEIRYHYVLDPETYDYEKLYSSAGMIVKYDSNKDIQWVKKICENGNEDEVGDVRITTIIQTIDNGYIVGGYYDGKIDLEDGITLEDKGEKEGMIIKFNSEGNAEWANSLNKEVNSIMVTLDGKYIVGCNEGLIKYNEIGNVEWNKEEVVTVKSIVSTSDGGFFVGGSFNSESIDLGNGVIFTNKNKNSEYSYNNLTGIIIKYDENGNIEWARAIGENGADEVTSVALTSDGGYIVEGYFEGDYWFLENGIDLGNGISINSSRRALIKYDAKGKAKWIKILGGKESVSKVLSTVDGGCAVTLNLGFNWCTLENGMTLIGNGNVIKYDSDGVVEYADKIGLDDDFQINSIIELSEGKYIIGGSFKDASIELENGDVPKSNGASDGILLNVDVGMPTSEISELTVENKRKEFKITTDVNEINGVKGGNISGEDESPYETVLYDDSNTKTIKMTPDTDYEIIKVTVNNVEYPFEVKEDGSFEIIPNTFTGVREDIHVEVTYALKDNKIVINKIDSKTNEPIAGAKFKLDQIEDREEPNISNIMGELTDNGPIYSTVADTNNEINGALGNLTNNGTYYFTKQGSTYVPNNKGKSSTTANSYIPINLSGYTGEYVVVVNTTISSQSSRDYGYVTITENTTAPSYSSSSGRFVYRSGTGSALDSTSMRLTGGHTYYLHLGYRKDGSTNTGEDQIVINSVKIYGARTIRYNFENKDGKYVSTNQTKASSTSNSYIPIDLRGYSGLYNLTVNAEISSETADRGYATITDNTTAPAYNSENGRFIYISGTQKAKDYITALEGGKLYYLHLGYRKDSSRDVGTDTFTINSVNITLNDSDFCHTEVETNSAGQAITQVAFGKYKITEITTPEGYEILEEPVIIGFRSDPNERSIIQNENTVDARVNDKFEYEIENRQLGKVIVHHYIKDKLDEAGNPVRVPVIDSETGEVKEAEDEYLEGKVGTKYTTSPMIDTVGYELQYELQEDGITKEYIIPDKAVGEYGEEQIVVIYYYEESPFKLTVHHYLDGTEDKLIEDVVNDKIYKNPGDYEAEPSAELLQEYDLVPESTRVNLDESKYTKDPETNKITGKIEQDTEVTYYYKLKKYNIKTRVNPITVNRFNEITNEYENITVKGGSISGEEETPYETVVRGDDSKKDIIITPDEGYRIKSITVKGGEDETGVDIEFTINHEDGKSVILDKFKNVTEDKEVIVEFKPIYGMVRVYHWIEGTEDPVDLADGTKAEVDEKTGYVGDPYATKPRDDVDEKYTYVSSKGETSGEYIDGVKEVIYYYRESISLEVTKKWNHTNNIYDKPREIILQVKNGEDVIKEKRLQVGQDEIEEDDDIWSYTFTGLPKYDLDTREEIKYTVDEVEVTNGDLEYYEKTIDDVTNTITNTYVGPIIEAVKGWTAETERTYANEKGEEIHYVLEGDTITYVITVTNKGGRARVVKVQDEIPGGTTFVDNSIEVKVNNTNVDTKGNLTDGVEATVPAKVGEIDGIATVSFKVKVEANAVEEGKFEGTITNIATVDGKDTDKVVTPVKKPYVVATKSANPESGDKVKANDEITYMIKLDNSKGTAPTKVHLKDSAPVGTMFKTGSITLTSVNAKGTTIEGTEVDLSGKTEADLKDTGIEVELEAGEIKVLSFVVTVVDTDDETETDLSNNTLITNTAQVSKNPEDANPTYEDTNEVTHIYVEPILSLEKTLETSNKEKTGGKYVEEGETITYTITVTNEGGLAKDVKVIDKLPDGVTFVDNTLKIDGKSSYTFNGESVDLTTKVVSDLLSGIDVNVPAKVGENNGTVILTFDVTVDMLADGEYYKELNNIAKVEKLTANADISVNKSNIKFGKTVSPEGNVQIGQELTYNVWVNNIGGTKSDIVKITDMIPDNTEYVANSVKLGSKTYTDEQLETGIDGITLRKENNIIKEILVENLEVKPDATIMLSFKVKVAERAENGYIIKNRAYINEKPTTPDTENPVVRPIIDVHKEIAVVTHITGDKDTEKPSDTLKDRKDYVFRGDKITYNIKATNMGDLDGRILIKDIISDKVELDVDSIKVGNKAVTGMTAEKFANEGIEVTVPTKAADKAGEVILSFTVTVKDTISDETATGGDVINKAIWSYKNPIEESNPSNPEKPEAPTEHETEEVKVPIVVIEKRAEIIGSTDENQEPVKDTVTANDEIKYTIVVTNTGTLNIEELLVTDTEPEGTTIKDNIKYHNNDLVDGELEDKTISWKINGLPAKQEGKSDNIAEVSFIVTVDYDAVASKDIVNVAYVNEKPTNEVEKPYVKPTPKIDTDIVKTGDETTMIGNKVYYKITYTGKINDFAGKACVTIVDELPYRIDKDKSELNGGTYKEDIENKKYTITWELEPEDINTYVSTEGYIAGDEYVISAEKEVWLYYTDELESQFTNKAIATTQLKEPDPDAPEKDKNVGEPDIARNTHTVTVKTTYKLPETGRNGTTIFAIIGLIIIGSIIVINYRAKHKEL